MIKKNTMVHYKLLPTDDQTPPASHIHGRCPKLTRYKLIGVFFVIIFITCSLVTLTRVQFRGPKFGEPKSSTSCIIPPDEETKKDKGDGVQPQNQEDLFKFNRKNYAKIKGSLVDPLDKSLRKRLPSVIVIGARKAGTRALLRFLSLHPHVVTAQREPHFFDRNYDEGLEWYQRKMPFSRPNQITVEKTPNYFVDWDVPERIYRYNSSIRLILIVRNPIDRAVSDYIQLKEVYLNMMANKTLNQATDWEKARKAGDIEDFPPFEKQAFSTNPLRVVKTYAPIKRSLYSRHLEKWLQFFNLSQILVVDGENIKVRPWEEMYKVEEFLGLAHKVGRDRFIYNETKGFFCMKVESQNSSSNSSDENLDSPAFIPYSERCLSPSKGREHPKMNPVLRQKLVEFFTPFNQRFFTRICQSFDWSR